MNEILIYVRLTTVIAWSKAQVCISWMVGCVSYHRNRCVRWVENTTSNARIIRFWSVFVTVGLVRLLVRPFSFGSTVGKPDLYNNEKNKKYISVKLSGVPRNNFVREFISLMYVIN